MTDIYRLIIKLNETRNETKKLEEFYKKHQADLPPRTQKLMAMTLARMHLCENILEKMIDQDLSTERAWDAVHESYNAACEQVRTLMSKL